MNISTLQNLIVDALEDVKGQDIKVFNTVGITSLFDRVVMASGTSNRQTKALAASVRDKVKEAGGHVISVEGEETGEWVLVDLGDAVVHIMQPTIRNYYNLEELWGIKPVSLRATEDAPSKKASAKTTSKTAAKKVVAKKAPAKKATAKAAAKVAIETPVKKVAAKKAVAKKAVAKKAPVKKAS